MAVDKAEYWAFIKSEKARLKPVKPTMQPIDPEQDLLVKEQQSKKRLYHAVEMVKSGLSRRKAAGLAHVGTERLRRALEELNQ